MTGLKDLEDYREIVGEERVKRIRKKAEPLKDKHIVNINSTSNGGGVAGLLNSIVPLMNSLGIDTGWRIHKGSEEFFKVTKSFHNALQGEEIDFKDADKKVYGEWTKFNSRIDHLNDHDLVVVHDPQPLKRVESKTEDQPWIWRCHIDMETPYKPVLNYLKRFINRYDGVVTTSKLDNIRPKQEIIPPSIDPFNSINRPMLPKEVDKKLNEAGIPTDKPIISQVGRFDKWKDPLGVISVWREVRREVDCRLVLLGNIASDDPEGPKMFEKVKKEAEKYDDLTVIAESDSSLVNALQRKSDVVLQKSIKEGFALTVSEALWKETPVIGTKVGGIPLQIQDGYNGYLAESDKEVVLKCIKLLKDRELADKMSLRGKEVVKEHFLITRQLEEWLDVYRQHLI